MLLGRVGVLGGTFDPIHNVHLLMASEVARQLALDHVLFSPVGEPSHRDPSGLSPAHHRRAMTLAALRGESKFGLTTVDMTRTKPTYTIDTVRDLRAMLGPSAELYVIVGADNLAELLDWKESDELVRLAHVVGTARIGYRLTDPGITPGRLTMLDIPKLPISSTLIRSLVKRGLPISHLTPLAVAQYIEEHGLYAA